MKKKSSNKEVSNQKAPQLPKVKKMKIVENNPLNKKDSTKAHKTLSGYRK